MTHQQMLQALATLNTRIHAMRAADADDIDVWCAIAGPSMEMHQFSDKTLENIAVLWARYFE